MATVYLAPAPTGDDSRTYAQAQNSATPWATVAKVNSSATSGDTVSMAAGTYTFSSETFSKSFTWNGAALAGGVPTTILDGAGASVTWTFNTTYGLNCSKIRFTNVVHTTTTSLFNFYVHTSTFTDCWFDTLTLYSTFDSIYALFGVRAFGAYVYNLTVTGCAFNNLAKAAAAGAGMIFATYGCSGTLNFTNNVFYYARTGTSNPSYVGTSYTATQAQTWKNNIFRVVGDTVYFWGYYASGGTVVGNNNCYASVGTIVNAPPSGTGNITSDPKLIDPTNGDFHLAHDSPALGMGTNL